MQRPKVHHADHKGLNIYVGVKSVPRLLRTEPKVPTFKKSFVSSLPSVINEATIIIGITGIPLLIWYSVHVHSALCMRISSENDGK